MTRSAHVLALVRDLTIAALTIAALPLAAQTADPGAQLYRTHCFVCHGPEGESIPTVSFRSGRFRRASSDDDISRLILGGIPGTAMPPTNLSAEERRSLVAYIRSMHNTGAAAKGEGDPAHGKSIFEGKGVCLACHRVLGSGSRLGPDLSEIGSLRSASYLEKSLIDPNETIAPANRYVHAVTKRGAVIEGRRLNEDTHTIQLIDHKERLVSLDKSDLREIVLVKTSGMPAYRDKLTEQERTDVVSYLLSLKGSP